MRGSQRLPANRTELPQDGNFRAKRPVGAERIYSKPTKQEGSVLRGNAVLVIMAAVWCELGFFLTRAPVAWFVVPPIISVVVFMAARRVFARLPARPAEEERRIGRLIGLWSAAEGIGFAIVGTALANTGLPALIPAALAVIVGMHFLPLARGMPNRLYYATGIAMIGAGVANILAPGGFGLRP